MIWKHTGHQIFEIYDLIQKREVEESNRRVRMMQAGRTNMKGDFIKLVSGKNDKSGKQKSERGLAIIGVASDAATKNQNPNLEVKGGED